MVAGPLRPAARADQEVDRLLLAHDDVLEPVLDGLRGGLAAGGLDRVLKRLKRFPLGLDQPGHGLAGVRCEAWIRDVGGGLAPQRGDLLDQVAGVGELCIGELSERSGQALVLEPEHAAR